MRSRFVASGRSPGSAVIAANKSAWFTRWFSGHAERRIRRTFAEVRIRGLESVLAELQRGPVLIVSNHTAWWDPLVSLVLCQRILGADAYAMMDAANLARLPFFAKVGAFGVSLEDPADGARAIRYAAGRLDRPGRIVWVFAQGREVPVTARPLRFRPGCAQIARVARRAIVVPVALRYEHGKLPEPSLWIGIGAALPPRPRVAAASGEDVAGACTDQERAVTMELERIDRAIVEEKEDGFQVVFRKRKRRWGRAAQALLAWITRLPARL